MHFYGLIIAAVCFFMIGICHPIVIKAEYHFGKGCWPVFLVLGLILIFISIRCTNLLLSIIIGMAGGCSLWSIKELYEQEQRVARGWFPQNPKRKAVSADNADKKEADSEAKSPFGR